MQRGHCTLNVNGDRFFISSVRSNLVVVLSAFWPIIVGLQFTRSVAPQLLWLHTQFTLVCLSLTTSTYHCSRCPHPGRHNACEVEHCHGHVFTWKGDGRRSGSCTCPCWSEERSSSLAIWSQTAASRLWSLLRYSGPGWQMAGADMLTPPECQWQWRTCISAWHTYGDQADIHVLHTNGMGRFVQGHVDDTLEGHGRALYAGHHCLPLSTAAFKRPSKRLKCFWLYCFMPVKKNFRGYMLGEIVQRVDNLSWKWLTWFDPQHSIYSPYFLVLLGVNLWTRERDNS